MWCYLTEQYLDDLYLGICEGRNFKNWDVDYLRIAQLYGNIIYMLPMLAFFIFNDPHDCYTCLGKDPDRIYSRF